MKKFLNASKYRFTNIPWVYFYFRAKWFLDSKLHILMVSGYFSIIGKLQYVASVLNLSFFKKPRRVLTNTKALQGL